MLVEDDPVLRDLIRLVLNQQPGFKLITANDGVEALEMFPIDKPDVILLDILLPRMNGLELLRRLKEQDMLGETVVLVISALGYQEIIQQVVDSGARDFIVKPFDIRVLVQRLRAVSSQRTPVGIHPLSVDPPES